MMDSTQDDEDGNSHMSDIQLQLSASANVASKNYAIRCTSDWGKSFTIAVSHPSRTLSVQQQFLDLKKQFNWLNKEHEKL